MVDQTMPTRPTFAVHPPQPVDGVHVDVNGRRWGRVVFGPAESLSAWPEVCAAEDADGELWVWDSVALFDALFSLVAMRHG